MRERAALTGRRPPSALHLVAPLFALFIAAPVILICRTRSARMRLFMLLGLGLRHGLRLRLRRGPGRRLEYLRLRL